MITRPETIHATLSVREAAVTAWDIIIIGADLAGILAAHELGKLGARTLLVDRDQLPHSATGGGCILGTSALQALSAAHLEDLLDEVPSLPLDKLSLTVGHRHLNVPLYDGWALPRAPFEAALLQRAIDRGVDLLSSSEAHLENVSESGYRHVQLSSGGDTVIARGQIVLATASACQVPPTVKQRWSRVKPQRWIGASTALPESPADYPPGTIQLLGDKRGMLTLARMADRQLQLHACFDRNFLDQQRTPSRAAATLLAAAGLPALELTPYVWRATTSPAVANQVQWTPRVLPLAGPTDGFATLTGEDTARSLILGRSVIPLALRGLDGWHHEQALLWQQRRSGILYQPNTICRAARMAVRHRHLTRWGVTLANRFPRLSQPAVRALGIPAPSSR